MTIVAATRCHYGSDYLAAVLKSTEGFADWHVVMYTPTPSFGPSTDLPNPDTREELWSIAQETAGPRLLWLEGERPSIQWALREFADADMILELDTDEVPHQDYLADILRRYQSGELDHYRYRLQMLHHWRSFRYVCRDPQRQLRLHLPHAPIQEEAVYPDIGRYLSHFGYAKTEAHMRYKWDLSAHKDDLRPGWWEKWLAFPDVLTDLYPVEADFTWNAEEFPDSELPAALLGHPYRYMKVIK